MEAALAKIKAAHELSAVEFKAALTKIQAAQELSAVEFKAAQNEEKVRTKRLKETIDEQQEWKRRMTKHAESAKELITLNVGGKLFCTSKRTLLTHEDTFFYHMLSSGVWQPDDAGHYFIDRSPRYFDIILDYLRGQLNSDFVEDLAPSSFFELLCEVDFYQLAELRDILRRKDWSFREMPGITAPAFSRQNHVVRRTDNGVQWALSSVAFTETTFWELLLISVGDRSSVKFGVMNRILIKGKTIDQTPEMEYIAMNLLGNITLINTYDKPKEWNNLRFGTFGDPPVQPGDKIGCLLQIRPSDAGPSALAFEFQGKWSDPIPLRVAGPYYAFVYFAPVPSDLLSQDSLQVIRFPAACNAPRPEPQFDEARSSSAAPPL